MIIELEQAKERCAALRETLSSVGNALCIDELTEKSARLTKEQEAEDFWLNMDHANAVSRELKAVNSKLDRFHYLEGRLNDCEELITLCIDEDEAAEIENINRDLDALDKSLAALNIETLLKGKYDSLNAIITLHAGAGGTEAQDWTSMLYRMYQRYCENRGYATSELDLLQGDEAGIKSVTFIAKGENAYGYLKAEKGVHRLVRISPFDANSRRHTSFASVEVMPEITETNDIVIRPEDLKVDTYRSSGAGGQHVNKTESAIRITHIPTGIIVACQNERSQIQNRETAMSMLRSKLAELAERKQMEEAAAIKGDVKKIEWGSQIRSYVFCPYTLVKDHRTGYENPQVQKVMDGDIQDFIVEYLKRA